MRYAKVRIYSRYERVWHGVQALTVLALLLTGMEVRGTLGLLGFATAVRLHDALGILLLLNAFLGLFWFLTTGAIRQYTGQPRDFLTLGARQLAYYLRGIFRGAPHPVERSPHRRLNPLQQITYVAILNVLLPWMVLSGFALWGMDRWPWLVAALGGTAVLVPLHALGAWLFAAFVILHVYLTTTAGRRPLSGIRSIVTGWEDLPVASEEEVSP